MNILAIESTGKTAAIAIANEEKILGQTKLNSGYTHSQTLLPIINDLLKILGIAAKEINYVACSSGPGSFTGIKIGAATAKAFAHGFNIPIINVPTLDAMALNIFAPGKIIVPVIDARREQVYSAIYKCKTCNTHRISDYLNCGIEEIIAKSLSFKKETIFLGDAVAVNKEKIEEAEIIIAPENLNLQSAESVVIYAKKMLSESENIFTYENYLPFYLRATEAEMKVI